MMLRNVLLVLACLIVFANAACLLTGVNQAGAEGGSGNNLGTNYVYPGEATTKYFLDKGMNVIRYPFKWERMIQPNKGSNFSTPDINAYLAGVDYMSKRAYVLIDPHNYGGGWGGKIGQSSTTIQDFADFWAKLATVFKSNPRVIYGLMNEPENDNNVWIWRNAAQAAVDAIRGVGATQTILVPGIFYSGGASWAHPSKNAEAMWDIVDPLNNYAYEIHQYLDRYSSGTTEECMSATVGAQRLEEFTEWARNYNKMGFLGEFGGGRSQVCLDAIDNMLTYMDQNTDVWLGWTYWAGGPWWPDTYFTTLQPNSTGLDRPQWPSIAPHLAKSIPSSLTIGKTTAPGPVSVAIYTDQFYNAWGDYSWAPRNNQNTSRPHSGDVSISFEISSGVSLAYVSVNTRLNVTAYTYLTFWMYFTSGSASGVNLNMVQIENDKIKNEDQNIAISNFLSTTFALNKWLQFTVPLANYTTALSYDGFSLRGRAAGFLDDIYKVRYVYGTSPTNPTTATSRTSTTATTRTASSSSGTTRTSSGSTATTRTSSASTTKSASTGSSSTGTNSATTDATSSSPTTQSTSGGQSTSAAPPAATSSPSDNSSANALGFSLSALLLVVFYALFF